MGSRVVVRRMASPLPDPPDRTKLALIRLSADRRSESLTKPLQTSERENMKLFGTALILLSIAATPAFAQEASPDVEAEATSSIPSYASIPSNAKSSGDLTANSHW